MQFGTSLAKFYVALPSLSEFLGTSALAHVTKVPPLCTDNDSSRFRNRVGVYATVFLVVPVLL